MRNQLPGYPHIRPQLSPKEEERSAMSGGDTIWPAEAGQDFGSSSWETVKEKKPRKKAPASAKEQVCCPAPARGDPSGRPPPTVRRA